MQVPFIRPRAHLLSFGEEWFQNAKYSLMVSSKAVCKSLFISIKAPCLYPLNLSESPSFEAETRAEEADKGEWKKKKES